MWLKNILRAFDDDIKVKYYIGDKQLTQYNTVKDIVDSGLMNYADVKEKSMRIEDNVIVIKDEGDCRGDRMSRRV